MKEIGERERVGEARVDRGSEGGKGLRVRSAHEPRERRIEEASKASREQGADRWSDQGITDARKRLSDEPREKERRRENEMRAFSSYGDGARKKVLRSGKERGNKCLRGNEGRRQLGAECLRSTSINGANSDLAKHAQRVGVTASPQWTLSSTGRSQGRIVVTACRDLPRGGVASSSQESIPPGSLESSLAYRRAYAAMPDVQKRTRAFRSVNWPRDRQVAAQQKEASRYSTPRLLDRLDLPSSHAPRQLCTLTAHSRTYCHE
eukprot:2974643-Pleurochrysis_carterae.AAC.3